MRNVDDLLEKMSEVSNELDGENATMNEEEKKKIHENVMKKINEEKVVSIEDRKGNKKGSRTNSWKRFSKVAVAAVIAIVLLLASATTMAALNINQSIIFCV